MNEIGVERLGTFGMPPPQLAALAAELGAECIGIGLASTQGGYNPDGHPAYSLRDDPAQLRATIAATRDLGVRVSIVEGFAVLADNDLRAYAGDLDIVRDLGCERINVVSVGQEMGRTIDGFAALCEVAAARGIAVSAEMGSLGPLKQVEAALEVARGVGQPNFSLVIDTMHVSRTGYAPMVARIDPALIGYVQINDGPMRGVTDGYLREAIVDRWVPGEGDYPLTEILRAVPPEVVVSIEVPMLDRPEGRSDLDHVRACVAGARRAVEAARRP